jgi:hypothetical protein
MSGKERPTPWVPTIVVVTVSALTLVANVASGWGSCATENAGCAKAGAPRLWLGRVLSASGEPVASARVEYYFASSEPNGSARGKALTVVTDGAGRYCVRWPAESAVAFVAVSSPPGDARVLVSPDASAVPGASYLIANSGQPNLTVTSRGWDAAADATGNCTTGAPAWYRIDDLKHNWRYRLLVYLPLFAVALSIAGVAARRAGTRVSARWASNGAAASAAAGASLYVLVWVTHSI